MTEPVEQKSDNVTAKTYMELRAAKLTGGKADASAETISTPTGGQVAIGVELSKGNLRGNLEAGAGSQFSLNAELKKELSVGQNFGCYFGAGAEARMQNSKYSYDLSQDDPRLEGNMNYNYVTAYADAHLATGVKFNTNNNKLQVEVGVQGGVITSSGANGFEYEKWEVDGGAIEHLEKKHDCHSAKKGAYLSPEVKVKYDLNNRVAFTGQANSQGAQAGVRITFGKKHR